MPRKFESLYREDPNRAGPFRTKRGLTLGEAYREILEPPPQFDDATVPVGPCEVLESLFRTAVTSLLLPPQGLRWPYIDGTAGFARPDIAVSVWSNSLTRVAGYAEAPASDRGLAAVGVALAFVIRDVRGFGHNWLARGQDWVASPRRVRGARSTVDPVPRRGMYDDSVLHGVDGEGQYDDLRLTLTRVMRDTGIPSEVRWLAEHAVSGVAALDVRSFARKCARALRRLSESDDNAGSRAGVGDPLERRHPSSNEFDLSEDGRHFRLGGKELGWYRGGHGEREWRRVTRHGPEGRLLASLLRPGAVPALVPPTAISHVRNALRGTPISLGGKGTSLRLEPYAVLAPSARRLLG